MRLSITSLFSLCFILSFFPALLSGSDLRVFPILTRPPPGRCQLIPLIKRQFSSLAMCPLFFFFLPSRRLLPLFPSVLPSSTLFGGPGGSVKIYWSCLLPQCVAQNFPPPSFVFPLFVDEFFNFFHVHTFVTHLCPLFPCFWVVRFLTPRFFIVFAQECGSKPAFYLSPYGARCLVLPVLDVLFPTGYLFFFICLSMQSPFLAILLHP